MPGRIFAIADTHLSFRESGGKPAKPMTVFGPGWDNHAARLADNWRRQVDDDDLVLIAGDISWAMRLEEAAHDLAFLDALPGRTIIIRGNHDYWVQSAAKTRKALPDSIDLVHHDCIQAGSVGIFGTRLWDVPGLRFPYDPQPAAAGAEVVTEREPDPQRDAKLLTREIGRLRLSVKAAVKLRRAGKVKTLIAMTHYPPVDLHGTATEASDIIAGAGATDAVFGHVHGVMPGPDQVTVDQVRYHLVSCDYVQCRLVELPVVFT